MHCDIPPDAEQRDVLVGMHGLQGRLAIPKDAKGLIIFAHGSGSDRNSPRELFVANALARRGYASLLFDLLGEAEARDHANHFDIAFLARRLWQALSWAEDRPDVGGLPVGLFGATTGAAAALMTAADAPDRVSAVVTRAGRPDLAEPALRRVRAPVLLIVEGDDQAVLDLNKAALLQLDGRARLRVVPHAGHLFQQPGALDRVAALAGDWFDTHCHASAAT